MNKFSQEELKNLLAIINIAPIKGSEATTVALLQQKISAMIAAPEEKPEEKPKK